MNPKDLEHILSSTRAGLMERYERQFYDDSFVEEHRINIMYYRIVAVYMMKWSSGDAPFLCPSTDRQLVRNYLQSIWLDVVSNSSGTFDRDLKFSFEFQLVKHLGAIDYRSGYRQLVDTPSAGRLYSIVWPDKTEEDLILFDVLS